MTQDTGRVATREHVVLTAAIALAQKRGFGSYSRRDVAAQAGVAVGTVSHAFGSMEALHNAVMRTAVRERILSILATGLALRHPIAIAAPPDLKTLALASLAA